jgi:hypothetical protein
VQSVIWAATESATTVTAASIPVLRKFFKDKVTTYRTQTGGSTSKTKSNTVPSTRRPTLPSLGEIELNTINSERGVSWHAKSGNKWYSANDSGDDNESGKSILREGQVPDLEHGAADSIREKESQ